MIRIAGVVVLYNPLINVLANIDSYRNQIDTLFVVDNSEKQDKELIEHICSLQKVVYIWNGENLGIAKALNLGATLAIERGYSYLLTMDQDSNSSSTMIHEYMNVLSNSSVNNIGVLAPYHNYKNYERPHESLKMKEVFTTITSGSLLSLDVYRKIGPFIEKLFIDYVDFEYCLRLQVNGFKVIQLNSIVLHHQLGAIESRKILFRRVAVYNYPPMRVYYKFRNRQYVAIKYFTHYPLWSMYEFVTAFNEMIKILLFEKNKLMKCKMAVLGMLHCLVNHFGKISVVTEK